jgi:TonB-dependent SusC/RagA subfamily outer membrane receptor
MKTFTVLLVVFAVGACTSGRRTGRPETDKPGTTATDDQWAGQSVSRAEELFVGRFPGVTVTRVPGGISVRIREGSTIMGSGEPLFVLDGMAIEAQPGGALVGINPADIQKIEVLKDIGSTAQYGVRGANGVILITTKRPK